MAFTAVPDKAAGDGVTLAMWNAIKDNLNKGVLRPIAHTELGASSASVTLSSIAADWVDLVVVVRTKNTTTGGSKSLRLNADTGANYGSQYVYWPAAIGCTSAAGATSIYAGIDGSSADGGFGGTIIVIHNYANTSAHKLVTWLEGGGNTNAYPSSGAGYWASTSAVTSVNLFPSANSFEIGSTFTLYGVAGI